MKDEELKAQISDIIEGEIQNGINDYLESQVDKLIKEYKQIKKFRKSNLGQVQKMGLVDKHGRPLDG